MKNKIVTPAGYMYLKEEKIVEKKLLLSGELFIRKELNIITLATPNARTSRKIKTPFGYAYINEDEITHDVAEYDKSGRTAKNIAIKTIY